MAKKLTAKAAAAYVRNLGNFCPFCTSHNMTGDSFDADSGFVSQEMSCDDCDATWMDVYRLVDIDKAQPGEGSGQ